MTWSPNPHTKLETTEFEAVNQQLKKEQEEVIKDSEGRCLQLQDNLSVDPSPGTRLPFRLLQFSEWHGVPIVPRLETLHLLKSALEDKLGDVAGSSTSGGVPHPKTVDTLFHVLKGGLPYKLWVRILQCTKFAVAAVFWTFQPEDVGLLLSLFVTIVVLTGGRCWALQ